ncbi:MAG TPA: O-antigen ligase family protein [Chitinophagaceae bacterium]|nr:O-antigen ligase family protein [Chitinophagaceae bacterium]
MNNLSLQQRNGLAYVLLVSLLVLFSTIISYAISVYGYTTGIIILTGIVGFAFLAIAFARPTLGFLLCIILGFIISVFERILLGIITLDFVVELMTYATFIGQVYKKKVEGESFWKGMQHPINYFMLAYLAYLLIECLNPNGSLGGALFSVRKTGQIVVLYITALSIFQSFNNIKQFFYFWIIASGLCGAYACYQQWVGFPAFEMDWIRSSEIRVAIYQLDNGSFRKFSTLTDPAAFGILMGVSALLTVVTILKAPIKGKKFWFAIALLFQVLGLSYSGTRTATFTLIAGIVLYILMTINNIKTLLFGVFCLLVFGFLMLVPIYGNVTINRFRSSFKFSKDASFVVRNNNRAKIQPYIYAHPIGGGPMTTGTNGLKYNPNHYLAGFPSDSGFLRSALEFGWLGLTLVCILFFVILQQGVHAFYKEKAPLARAFLIAAVVALFGNIVSQYSQVAIGATPEIFLYHAMIATIVCISKLDQNKKWNV